MLKNVISEYFIQKVFSFLTEYPKLKMVRYNKNMQKNLEINITNYIHFKGNYIIYELNGKGKEFSGYDDKLMLEG